MRRERTESKTKATGLRHRLNPVWPIAILGLVLPLSATADTLTGYVKTTCLPNSDTAVSVPFKRKAIFSGTISSVSAPPQSR